MRIEVTKKMIRQDISNTAKCTWLTKSMVKQLLNTYCHSEILSWKWINWTFICWNIIEIINEKRLRKTKWFIRLD